MQEAPTPLSAYWLRSLQEGRLNTALLLSTVFSEKYNGRNMEVGEVAEIFLPTASDPVTCEPGEPRQLRPKLLFRAGCLQASPFLWVGDEEAGDDTLYVCFGPLRQKRQVMKIFSSGSTLEEDVVKCGDSTQVVRVSNYIKSLLDRLWADDRLGERLSAAVAERPGHRVLFAGVSHGAVLAQAAALRFKLTRSDPDAATQTLSGTGQTRCGSGEVTVVSWNGYKWTDAQGAALAGQQLRLLPLALSMVEAGVRLVDSVVEYPAGEFEPMPGVTALDFIQGSGRMHNNNVELRWCHPVRSCGIAKPWHNKGSRHRRFLRVRCGEGNQELGVHEPHASVALRPSGPEGHEDGHGGVARGRRGRAEGGRGEDGAEEPKPTALRHHHGRGELHVHCRGRGVGGLGRERGFFGGPGTAVAVAFACFREAPWRACLVDVRPAA